MQIYLNYHSVTFHGLRTQTCRLAHQGDSEKHNCSTKKHMIHVHLITLVYTTRSKTHNHSPRVHNFVIQQRTSSLADKNFRTRKLYSGCAVNSLHALMYSLAIQDLTQPCLSVQIHDAESTCIILLAACMILS